jgi:SAM-dependent methyltransferase
LRFRTLISGLSVGLFDQTLALPDFPKRPDVCGIGLSDAQLYAGPLARKLSYINTFYHTDPLLDITDIGKVKYRDLDFLIASDVFEHVPPPISLAFENARRLLRSGGVLVFSVPHRPGQTKEHFPDLFDYSLERRGDGFVLLNKTVDGRHQEFDDLVFHGGPGATLEMRVFGYDDIVSNLERAGFGSISLLSDSIPQFGIDYTGEVCSIPMTARAI